MLFITLYEKVFKMYYGFDKNYVNMYIKKMHPKFATKSINYLFFS